MKKIICVFTALVLISGCDSLLEQIGEKEKITNVVQERDGITYLPNEEKSFTGKYQYLRQKLGRPGVNSADFCGLENSVVD